MLRRGASAQRITDGLRGNRPALGKLGEKSPQRLQLVPQSAQPHIAVALEFKRQLISRPHCKLTKTGLSVRSREP